MSLSLGCLCLLKYLVCPESPSLVETTAGFCSDLINRTVSSAEIESFRKSAINLRAR
jgi:hypothetical protein